MVDFVQMTPPDLREIIFKIIYDSLKLTQETLNQCTDGVYYVDFKRFASKDFFGLMAQGHRVHPLAMDTFLLQLYLEEKVYANSDFTKYSVVPVEGYKKWSEIMEKKYKGYEFDIDKKILVNGPDSKTFNFKQIQKLLASQKTTLTEEDLKLIQTGDTHFLDQTEHIPKIFFCSYPRSGNTLTRKYFEKITSIVTGSTMPNSFLVNFQMMFLGFKGETYYDDRVWLYKSHHPFVLTPSKDQRCSLALMCLRNPVDAISSQVQMRMTNTNQKSMKNNFAEEFPEEWDRYVKESTGLWKNQVEYWIKASRQMKVPVYFYRYEDLLSDPLATLTGIFKFCLKIEKMEGTVIEQRIKHVIEMGEEGHTLYKPRDKGEFVKNSKKFTEEQLKYIGETCSNELDFCNYTKYFFEEHKSEDNYNFEESNKLHMKWIVEKGEDIDKIDIDVMDIVDDAKDIIGKYYTLETNMGLNKCQDQIYIQE